MLNFRRRMSSFEDFSLELDYVLTNGILLLVVDNSSQRPVGYVVAHNVNPWDGWASVGMYVEPQLRGRGHGGEAALLAVDSFFRIFPLRKVITEVYDFAQPLLSMTRAMGFDEVGYLADHFWFEDRNWGLHSMVLTRERWYQFRERFTDILSVQQSYDELVSVRDEGG